MTTDDEQATGTRRFWRPQAAPTERPATPSAETETSAVHDSAPPQDAPVHETGPAEPAQPREPRAEASETGAESSTTNAFFDSDDLAGLRSRWDGVQAGFVDDPKACVKEADALVVAAVEQLTTGFSDTRSRIEERWARRDDASTEDLRLALMGYREFFHRLLAV